MFSETEEEQKAMMTAETHPSHKSSSPAGDSYLGSLLSLTSKSEIRYEGILINVNTEEASIALRNVKAFGTEGRKMDGPQVPPSEKIFEYILFRASDIKDLQVKSSPPIQSTMSVPNDPAIIDSHYNETPTTSTSLPSSGSGNESEQDPSLQTSLMELRKPTFQGSLAIDQPNAHSESWGPSQPPVPSNNMSELAMPTCGQGVYESSNGFLPQSHQHSLPRPLPALSMPPSMQQTMHHHPMPASYASVVANSPTPKLPSPVPRPPLRVCIPRSASSVLAAKSPPIASDTVASLIPNDSCSQSLPHAPLSTSSPTQLTSEWDEAATLSAVPEESKPTDGSVLPHLTVSETAASLVGTPSSHHKGGPTQSPITPGQLLQSAPHALTKPQPSLTAQKDVEVVQVPSPQLTPRSAPSPSPSPAESIMHEQMSPLAPQSEQKMMCPVARYGEDFEFMGMNQKFNKDDGWSDLGNNDNGWDDRRNNDNGWGDGRNNENGWGDRGNNDNGWGDRRNNDSGWADRGNNDKGWGNWGNSDKGWCNRGNSDKGWGDRGNNDKGWGDRGNNDKGWSDRGNNDKGWGDVGNNDRGLPNGDRDHQDDNGASKDEVKPVYVKDDFFDSLSGVPADHGSYNGRARFTDQMRKDSETFGYFPRHHRGGYGGQGGRAVRGGRGGCGTGYNGRSRDLIMSTPKSNNTPWCGIRYQNKQCFCQVRAEIKVTENGQNVGKLFYACKFDKCRFWQWCDPITNMGLESIHYGNARETQTSMEVKKLMTENCDLLTQNKDLKMELKKACLKSVELKTELGYAQTRLREAENLNNMLKSGIFATFVLCVIVLILVINVMSK